MTGGEGGHEAIAGVLDLGATVGLEGIADDAVVGAQHLLGLGIAQALGEGGRALHVGEEDGDKAGRSRSRCGLVAFAQELVDGRHQRLRVTDPRHYRHPFQKRQTGIRYP